MRWKSKKIGLSVRGDIIYAMDIAGISLVAIPKIHVSGSVGPISIFALLNYEGLKKKFADKCYYYAKDIVEGFINLLFGQICTLQSICLESK